MLAEVTLHPAKKVNFIWRYLMPRPYRNPDAESPLFTCRPGQSTTFVSVTHTHFSFTFQLSKRVRMYVCVCFVLVSLFHSAFVIWRHTRPELCQETADWFHRQMGDLLLEPFSRFWSVYDLVIKKSIHLCLFLVLLSMSCVRVRGRSWGGGGPCGASCCHLASVISYWPWTLCHAASLEACILEEKQNCTFFHLSFHIFPFQNSWQALTSCIHKHAEAFENAAIHWTFHAMTPSTCFVELPCNLLVYLNYSICKQLFERKLTWQPGQYNSIFDADGSWRELPQRVTLWSASPLNMDS